MLFHINTDNFNKYAEFLTHKKKHNQKKAPYTHWVDLKPVKPKYTACILPELEIHPTRILSESEYTRSVFNPVVQTDRSIPLSIFIFITW